MLRAIGVVLLAALTLFVAPAAAQTWTEFRPEGIGFAVEMPGQWTLSNATVNSAAGPLKVGKAELTLGQRVLIVSYVVYPEQVVRSQPADKLLDGARDGTVEQAKGKLRKEERLTVSDLPAREIIIDAPSGLTVAARFFLLRNALVQALTAGPRGVESEPDTRRYLTSLKVVSP